jgi:autophagy-related protein 16
VSRFLCHAASHHFVAHDGEVNAIRYSPQGKFLATGGADRKVKLWKEEGGKAELVGTLTGEQRTTDFVELM